MTIKIIFAIRGLNLGSCTGFICNLAYISNFKSIGQFWNPEALLSLDFDITGVDCISNIMPLTL